MEVWRDEEKRRNDELMKKKKRVELLFFFAPGTASCVSSLSLSLFPSLLRAHRAVEVTAEARVRMATEVMACCWRKARGLERKRKGERGMEK